MTMTNYAPDGALLLAINKKVPMQSLAGGFPGALRLSN